MVTRQKQRDTIDDNNEYNESNAINESQSHQLQQVDWLQTLRNTQHQVVGAQDRLYWMLQLRDHIGSMTYTVLDYQLMLDLAVRLCDWVMINRISDILLNIDMDSISPQEYVKAVLTNAEVNVLLGNSSQALRTLECALLTQHHNADLLNSYQWVLDQYQPRLTSAHTVPNDYANDIALTPLELHHIDGFRCAYINQNSSRKSVAELCNLPIFNNDEEWLDWLHTCHHYSNYTVYAVIHSEWGFIGSVCLEVHHGVGFFYYWLGEDFQGYGFGPQAVDILFTMGTQEKGMTCCYATVYCDNHVSLKALKKIGFRHVPIKLAAPYSNTFLYYIGPDKPPQQWNNELQKLFVEMKSDYRLDVTQSRLLDY